MGCDTTYFERVDDYGKFMFTCPLPQGGKALRGGGQGRETREDGDIGGDGVSGGILDNNMGMRGRGSKISGRPASALCTRDNNPNGFSK